MPDIVSHPFFQNGFVIDEESKKLVNILENKSVLDNIKKQIIRKIDKVETFMQFTSLITIPYRLVFLKFAKDYLSVEDFSSFLIDSWVNDEYANRNKNITKRELLKYFKIASKEYLMNKDELETYSKLEDELIIYRGLTDYNKSSIKVLSWTLNKETAKWFANRFELNGYIYQAKIKKKDILTFCNQRNEKEVIVDYTKLYDIQMLEND